jgi:hypothetical protein
MKRRSLSSVYPYILSSKLLYGIIEVQYWVFLNSGKGFLSVTFGPLKLKVNYISFCDVIEVKLSLCLTKHYAIKTYGGVDYRSTFS